MMCWASRTGTRRNLDALGRHGWGLLISRAGVWRVEEWTCPATGERIRFRIVADNGAWSDFQTGQEFDEEAFERFLIWLSGLSRPPEWLVLPDMVAGGLRSLELSTRYLNRCLSVAPLVLIAVQDGMEHADLAPLVGPNVGIFLGGSTEWKLARMADWGAFCRERGCHYHVARVNTVRRIRMAHAAAADSIDGTSATRFAVTLPMIDAAARQPDLFGRAA
ncbi:hypothetical protein MKK84_32790 [Methylobacterium sp. E-065]|uniref:hypothetical protein n=1 Tax=Methylobacterium sp. E-065 TaxID=2836583 RepID=UPI001FB91169|nr:hypothetical protein [Methylobacterium sp. E-065]MCJ2022126.1 hypothetical protein [Methylobacterium sp. E-065]